MEDPESVLSVRLARMNTADHREARHVCNRKHGPAVLIFSSGRRQKVVNQVECRFGLVRLAGHIISCDKGSKICEPPQAQKIPTSQACIVFDAIVYIEITEIKCITVDVFLQQLEVVRGRRKSERSSLLCHNHPPQP